MKKQTAQKWTIRILIILTFLTMLTGFGITHPSVIGPLTLGLMEKSLSHKIHTILWGPFLIAVLIHIYLSTGRTQKISPEKENKDK